MKMTLFDQQYQLIESQKFAHKHHLITDIIFELNLEEIWGNLIFGLEKWLADYKLTKVELILTTAMHSIQLLNQNMQLVGSLITWADNRGTNAIGKTPQIERENQYYQTGTPIHPMNPYFKLLELFDDSLNDDTRDKLDKGLLVGSLKDVLYYRLTGDWVVDIGNASSSGLLDLKNLTWDSKSLHDIGLSIKQLPSIKPLTYSRQVNMPLLSNLEMTVILGTSDGVSSNFVFNDLPHTAVLSIGTSHAIRIIHHDVQLDYHTHNFCYAIDENQYLVGIPSNNGANIFSWANRIFNSTFDELNEIMKIRPAVSATFLPYLNGERGPIWDDRACASFTNLSRNDDRKSILFSLILGMIFNIKENVNALSDLVAFDSIGLVGGVTQLESFPQLLSDVLGIKLYLPKIENAETVGSIRATRQLSIVNDYRIVTPNMIVFHQFNEAYVNYQKQKNLFYTNESPTS